MSRTLGLERGAADSRKDEMSHGAAYRDVVANEHSGPGGAAIEVATKPDLSQLSNEELTQLRAIVEKTGPAGGD